MSLRIDQIEPIYEIGERLKAEDADLRIGLITTQYAEDHRDWSEPVRFKIVPDDNHPGLEIVHFQVVE
jgi:hypothetical protein